MKRKEKKDEENHNDLINRGAGRRSIDQLRKRRRQRRICTKQRHKRKCAKRKRRKRKYGSKASLTKVRILCKNDNVADVKTENWMDLKVGQALAEKLAEIGIELELECVDNESFSKVVSTRMAADSDMPDLIGWMGESSTTVEDWARGGLLLPRQRTGGPIRYG